LKVKGRIAIFLLNNPGRVQFADRGGLQPGSPVFSFPFLFPFSFSFLFLFINPPSFALLSSQNDHRDGDCSRNLLAVTVDISGSW
jgi:hypothetical protein